MHEEQRRGVSISQVARENGVNWRTAKKYMQSPTPPKYKKRQNVPGKLDPYKDYIRGRLEHFPLQAWRLFEEIRALGYEGKYSLVKEFVRPIKLDRAIAAELRYETKPGEQAQVDWFHFGPIIIDGQRKTLWCFSMILSFSRQRFIRFTTDAMTATFIQCHLEAFGFFGGWPKTILYDNTSNVVTKRMLKSSDSVWNTMFEDFFRFYGIVPRLCKPGKDGAKTKGKIERTGQYIRRNFFMGLDFSSIDDLNGKGIGWCNKVNMQIHGTTHAIPAERLKEEKLTLIDSRPPYQIVITEHRRVSRDCYVSFRGNKYSVPWKNAGREAKLLIRESMMNVEIGGETICTHEILPGVHRLVRIKEHFAGLYKDILHRNRDVHARRIEGKSTKSEPVILKSGLPGEIEVQKRDLSVYDNLANRGDAN